MRASNEFGERQAGGNNEEVELQNKLEGNIDLKIAKFFDIGKRLKGQILAVAAREREALAELH